PISHYCRNLESSSEFLLPLPFRHARRMYTRRPHPGTGRYRGSPHHHRIARSRSSRRLHPRPEPDRRRHPLRGQDRIVLRRVAVSTLQILTEGVSARPRFLLFLLRISWQMPVYIRSIALHNSLILLTIFTIDW